MPICFCRIDTFPGYSESECWMFYVVPTARVIFMTKTILNLFSLT